MNGNTAMDGMKIERGQCAVTELAADGGSGSARRIRGVANTFGVMRSGRIIHPAAVENWLKAQGDTRLPLLAQHGQVDGFATIGSVDTLRVDRKRGLLFEATLAAGVPLADQAWALVQQHLLGNLSVGWVGKQARFVRADDADVDPWLAGKMKEAGVTECYAFLGIDLVEISLVDVGDDPGGKLAASRAAAAAFEAALTPVRAEIAALRADVQKLTAARQGATLTRADLDAFLATFESEVLTVLQSADVLAEAADARQLLQDLQGAGADADGSEAAGGSGLLTAPGVTAELADVVAGFGKGGVQ
jgi:HK97 family phage prohead protease